MERKCLKVVILLLAINLFISDSLGVNYAWTGDALDGLWKTPENWNPLGPPPPDSGVINLTDQNNGSDITIDSTTDAVVGGDPTGGEIYGPEWGMHLHIVGGSLTGSGFLMYAVGNDEAGRSVVNVSEGGQLNIVNLLIGDSWWFTGPYATLNVYDNSTVTVSDWIWLGGHMNIYGGSVDVTGGFNMAVNTAELGTTKLDIWDGALIIRSGDYTAQVNEWIANGYLTAYNTTPGPGGGDIIIDTTTISGSTILTAVQNRSARNPNPTPLNENGTVGTLISSTEAEVTLNWWAGADPNIAVSGNEVNPEILTHYIWISTSATDPNLDYLDSVVQTSLTDPNASYGPITLMENTT